jgi:hypothetical protein
VQESQAGVSVSEYQRTAEFRAALRRFFRVSEDAARRHDLTPRRHLLLLMIKGAADGSESSTVSELSERMQLAQSTVTELVQRAEAAGSSGGTDRTTAASSTSGSPRQAKMRSTESMPASRPSARSWRWSSATSATSS